MKKIVKYTLYTLCTLTLFIGSTTIVSAQNKGKVIELTESTFKSRISPSLEPEKWKYQSKLPSIIVFMASWAEPCNKLKPILTEVAKELTGKINIFTIDIEKCADITEAFEIESVPTIMYFPLNNVPEATIGIPTKEILIEQINSLLLND